MHIVRTRCRATELKELTKVQRLGLIVSNGNDPSDKDEDGTRIGGGLHVHGSGLVRDSADPTELFNDRLCAVDLIAFECQHGFLRL